jgi:acyl-CoA thioester hydrolase
MLDRTDFEPVFFAPFVSSVMTVEPAWIDFNGHMNMAYYNVLFDRGLDELYNLAGLGQRYLEERKHSFFTAELHVRYLRELREGAPVRVTFQLLDFDSKRMHFFQQLFHATEGWISATSENLSLHVDMTAKKAALLPPDVAKRLGDIRTSHVRLPRPEAVGRRIAMPGKS